MSGASTESETLFSLSCAFAVSCNGTSPSSASVFSSPLMHLPFSAKKKNLQNAQPKFSTWFLSLIQISLQLTNHTLIMSFFSFFFLNHILILDIIYLTVGINLIGVKFVLKTKTGQDNDLQRFRF